MKKGLVIAEKPSLMRTIRDVYEKHKNELPYELEFIAQQGHLLTLKLPSELDPEQAKWSFDHLPFFPTYPPCRVCFVRHILQIIFS